jgi:hypothetical protein
MLIYYAYALAYSNITDNKKSPPNGGLMNPESASIRSGDGPRGAEIHSL